MSFSEMFGYAVALITVCGGLIIVLNIFDFVMIPYLRYTFGSVILLIGIYRFVITRLKYGYRFTNREGDDSDSENE
jgi:hypothetical protein